MDIIGIGWKKAKDADYYRKLSDKKKFKQDMMELFLPYMK